MKNPATLYVVRHGQTDWNVQKRVQGQIDIPLNTTGEAQAVAARERFEDISFDAVFSSDLLRARHTAELIALERELAVQTSQALRERSFGKLEGILIEDLKKLENEASMLPEEKRFAHRTHLEIETDEELMGRFITFLREISVAYAGKTVLVVCHGSVIRTFLIHLGVGDYTTLSHGTIENTAHIKLLSDGVDFEVEEFHGIHLASI